MKRLCFSFLGVGFLLAVNTAFAENCENKCKRVTCPRYQAKAYKYNAFGPNDDLPLCSCRDAKGESIVVIKYISPNCREWLVKTDEGLLPAHNREIGKGLAESRV